MNAPIRHWQWRAMAVLRSIITGAALNHGGAALNHCSARWTALIHSQGSAWPRLGCRSRGRIRANVALLSTFGTARMF